MSKQTEQLNYLKRIAATLTGPAQRLAYKVIEDPQFQISPASIQKHHNFEGGLLEHTVEILQAALAIQALNPVLNRTHIILGVLWHDYGKIYDYTYNATTQQWEKTPHYSLVRHVSRSFSCFAQLSREAGLEPTDILAIEHILLSHHGHLEWGSPVTPKTREAYLVHISDMLSVHCLAEKPRDNSLDDTKRSI